MTLNTGRGVVFKLVQTRSLRGNNRLFGKAEVQGERRLGVALALGYSLEEGRRKAKTVASRVRVHL
jgi:formate-dependent phosphoribosylglycinamide formyltransferase (GAR transformylase)